MQVTIKDNVYNEVCGRGLPENPWCRWGRSWGRRRPETTQTPCWWYELCNPEEDTASTPVRGKDKPTTRFLKSGRGLTVSPGIQCSLWVTSTPARLLYMMTEETNTEERSRVTAVCPWFSHNLPSAKKANPFYKPLSQCEYGSEVRMWLWWFMAQSIISGGPPPPDHHIITGYCWWCCTASTLRWPGEPGRPSCCGKEAACGVTAGSEPGCREPPRRRSVQPPPGVPRTASFSAWTEVPYCFDANDRMDPGLPALTWKFATTHIPRELMRPSTSPMRFSRLKFGLPSAVRAPTCL